MNPLTQDGVLHRPLSTGAAHARPSHQPASCTAAARPEANGRRSAARRPPARRETDELRRLEGSRHVGTVRDLRFEGERGEMKGRMVEGETWRGNLERGGRQGYTKTRDGRGGGVPRVTAVADWSDSDGKAGSRHEAEEESEAGSSSSRDGLYCRDTGQRAPMCDVTVPACGVSVHQVTTTVQPAVGGNPTAARQSDPSVVASSASPLSPQSTGRSPQSTARSLQSTDPSPQSAGRSPPASVSRRPSSPDHRAEPRSGARRRRH